MTRYGRFCVWLVERGLCLSVAQESIAATVLGLPSRSGAKWIIDKLNRFLLEEASGSKETEA